MGFALAASVVLHALALGLLESLANGAGQVPAAVAAEPPLIVSVTLAEATIAVPPATTSELAVTKAPREIRRREPVARPTAGERSLLAPAAAEIALVPRETASPEAHIAAPSLALPPPASFAAEPAHAGATPASVATSDALAPPRAPASAPVSYLLNPAPPYPESARRDGQEGLTVVEVLVSSSGIAVDVKVATTSGVAALDRAAVAGVRQWLFTPASRDDAAIDARIRIPIRFRLNDRGN